jgi:hypothetical protein
VRRVKPWEECLMGRLDGREDCAGAPSLHDLVGTNDPLHHASADPKLLGNLEDANILPS